MNNNTSTYICDFWFKSKKSTNFCSLSKGFGGVHIIQSKQRLHLKRKPTSAYVMHRQTLNGPSKKGNGGTYIWITVPLIIFWVRVTSLHTRWEFITWIVRHNQSYTEPWGGREEPGREKSGRYLRRRWRFLICFLLSEICDFVHHLHLHVHLWSQTLILRHVGVPPHGHRAKWNGDNCISYGRITSAPVWGWPCFFGIFVGVRFISFLSLLEYVSLWKVLLVCSIWLPSW